MGRFPRLLGLRLECGLLDRLQRRLVTRLDSGRRVDSGVGFAEPATGANVPWFARACSACGSANEPFTSLPVWVALGSATVRLASPAVLTTVAAIVVR